MHAFAKIKQKSLNQLVLHQYLELRELVGVASAPWHVLGHNYKKMWSAYL